MELETQPRGEDSGGCQNVDVGGEDEIVFETGAEIGVTTARVDVEGIGKSRVDGEVEGP